MEGHLLKTHVTCFLFGFGKTERAKPKEYLIHTQNHFRNQTIAFFPTKFILLDVAGGFGANQAKAFMQTSRVLFSGIYLKTI